MTAQKDLCRSVFMIRRKEQGQIGKGAQEEWGRAQSISRKCDTMMCLFLCGDVTTVGLSKLCNWNDKWGSFLSFVQQLMMAILFVAPHLCTPWLSNWIRLWKYSWSDSLLVLRLFPESRSVVTFTNSVHFRGFYFYNWRNICNIHHQGNLGNCFLPIYPN